MSDPHTTDQPGHEASAGLDHRDPADHGNEPGHDDAHGNDTLGPVDLAAWGAGIAGVAISLVIAAFFALATAAPV